MSNEARLELVSRLQALLPEADERYCCRKVEIPTDLLHRVLLALCPKPEEVR